LLTSLVQRAVHLAQISCYDPSADGTVRPILNTLVIVASFVDPAAAEEAVLGTLGRDSLDYSLLRSPDVPGCNACFAAGTPVDTPRGEVPIDHLHVGDQVLSEDPQTGKVEAERVQAVIHDPAAPLVAVDLTDGSTITTTATHVFWVDAGLGLRAPAWQQAQHLRAGDQLRRADGGVAIVARVRMDAGTAPVYTLTVAKDHTFFVGAAKVLVHNSSCKISTTASDYLEKGLHIYVDDFKVERQRIGRFELVLRPDNTGNFVLRAFFGDSSGLVFNKASSIALNEIFDPRDPAFRHSLLQAAERAYQYAVTNPQLAASFEKNRTAELKFLVHALQRLVDELG
jgi:hypothetical protein